MEAITQLSDIQSKIFGCYTGLDKEMFSEIAPWCSRCDLIAINPHGCFICQSEMICGTCIDKGLRICDNCSESNENDPDN